MLCLYRRGDQLSYDAEGLLPLTLGARAGTPARRRQERDLLLNTLALPAHWFRGNNPLPPPRAWPTPHPLLSRLHVAVFDPTGPCVSGPQDRLHYDPVTGLAKRCVGGAERERG
ncbi:hypothetical protein [Streptomyces sp. NPDC090022]|uniref:hypothetical protein n=1 Tax=Streptomyces sp. NPDC090022 TaxID=3365920 RepID=UPI00380B9AF3